MFRNQYDTDVTTFSPAGRIHQVEYAAEGVKQGSACVGLRSKEIVVLSALMRSPSELASHHEKVFKVDNHLGIAISGLIADARVLCKYMRSECLNHRYVFESEMQVGRLVTDISDKSQVYTQRAEKRPYGVGLLVAGYDKTGPHLYETSPSGNFYEFHAQAIGARAQSAKTYLERNFESFDDQSLEQLIHHSLHALKGTSPKGKINAKSVQVAYVGKDLPFTILSEDEVTAYVEAVVGDEDDEAAEDGAEEAAGDSRAV